MIPREILEATAGRANDREFERLIINWGLWARYSGIQGYSTGHQAPSYAIGDDAALMVDAAMCRLREIKPLHHRLIVAYYVRGKSFDDIKTAPWRVPWRSRGISRGANYYAVNLTAYLARTLGPADIKERIDAGLQIVFEFLKELVSEGSQV